VPLAALLAFGQVVLSSARATSKACAADGLYRDNVLAQKLRASIRLDRMRLRIQADGIAASILTSGKEPYRSRGDLVRRTWAPYFEAFEAFTFDANPHFDNIRRVDPYGSDEGTERATGMNLAMIPEMLALHPSAKWYLQADDDTLLLPLQWRSVAAGMDWREPVLGGKCALYPNDDMVEFVVGGSGILISRGLAEKLAPHVLECRKEFNWYDYGDARIGGCMRKVLGENYTDAMHDLRGATNSRSRLQEESMASHQILSLQEKNATMFQYVWSHLEADIAAGHEVTGSMVRALLPNSHDDE